MSSYLPEEVVVNILSHLPPKSLLRFRCVSKTWLALIGTPDFVSKNLINNSILNTKSQHPYPPFLLVKAREESNSPPPFLGLGGIVSSSNGILCLHDHFQGDVYLWNPSSSLQLLALSRRIYCPRTKDFDYVLGLEFGFDYIADDFKVVRFLDTLNTSFMADTDFVDVELEVYSLGPGLGKQFDTILDLNMLNIFVPYERAKVYDNGFFYWWVGPNEDYDERIVSFDCRNEVFRMTPLPDKSVIGDCNEVWRSLMVLNGFVAMAVHPFRRKKKVSFSIWVLLEFGVKESWTKLFRIGHYFDLEWPLCFCKNGELLMENREGELVLYDPFTQTTKNVQLNGLTKSFLNTQSSGVQAQ
ncbi:F-box protein At3g07870-like [Quercus robur]|uniref:F-box protein At3g07870-like n=1 Tax=Quercus robur TaxID=38942 RepID=UPI0021613538|nr:F-box protein At3g07870-like [Quercus robur]XP_050282539.1 F-box protein At3g07870-like [Quercus robur]XP_050282540.1 F-box protein At3g07870-like [Quercus robur]